MLRTYTSVLFFLCFIVYSLALSATPKVDIDLPAQFYEQAPIEGTILISHGSKETIDVNSFELNKNPLKVELKQEQPMTAPGDLILSMYHFSLPPQLKGLYILPAIKVNIAGKTYQSVPRTYEVKLGTSSSTAASIPEPTVPSSAPSEPSAATPAPYSPAPPAANGGALFKLEAFVNGPKDLYPGQRTIVGYRYFYNVNLETTKEAMPLLEAEGFTKIGDKVIKEEQSGDLSAQQIEQTIEAIKPGEYIFGPSYLEARPYTADSLKRHIPTGEILNSVAPMIVLNVKPFPEENKPASFNGAVGKFDWNIELKSPKTIHVGDEIELLVEVRGQGNLDSVNLPELCCQPGMSGLFSMSDLPPIGIVTDNVKKFQVKLKPQSTSIKDIPSLEFSSFNPETHEYSVYHSKPIPLNVIPFETPKTLSNETSSPLKTREKGQQIIEPETEKAAPIEIESLYPLTANDLENLPFGTWASLFIIPIGLGGLLFQQNLKNYLKTVQEKPKIITSNDLFKQALKSPLDSSQGHILLNKAFLLGLKEKGVIASEDEAIEDLPSDGIAGEIRTFLFRLEENRYAGTDRLNEEQIREKATALFGTLQHSGVQS